MVIAHVIDSLEVGGAEAVVAALGRLQRQAGHALEVHCLITGGPLAAGLADHGVRVVVHEGASGVALIRRLVRAFRQSRPDVVHCHNKTATRCGAIAARLSRVPTVISTRHGMAPPPYRLRKELRFWLTATLFCDRVVAVCDAARRNMRSGAGRFARHVVTIRNGAYLPASADAPSISANGFTIVSVGRLAVAKNYAMLLRAFASARRRVPDLGLWILGDGPEGPALRQLANELGVAGAVTFWGEQRDVGPWLRAADAFALSSTSEGLPISALEAMAAGLPAILTDVGGMTELVALSGAGTIVPSADAEAMAEAFVELAARRDALEDVRQRAARCYREHFTPERMTNEYLALYQACGGGARTPAHD
jgi:glycosyltransferase involved in cell wall biosynthesis